MNPIRILLAILYITACCEFSVAQNPSDIKRPGSGYLWGEGVGKTLQEADKNALDDLAGQISITVSSRFAQISTQQGNEFEQYVKSIINTYSNVSLNKGTRRFTDEVSLPGKVTVLRYIPENEVNNIFENRKQKN